MKLFQIALALAAVAYSYPQASIAETVKVTGSVQGMTIKDNDGFVDGALVLPSVKAEAILRFDLENLMAPNEILKAGPEKVPVPGNLNFPPQDETYIFFPITIEKKTFSFYPERGVPDELYALWFRVPFDDLVKMGKDKAPFTEMIPLVKLQKFAFEGMKDWSGSSSIRLNTNKSFTRNVAYSWKRSPALEGSSDLAVAFQRTPGGRWMISDLAGKPAEAGAFASSEGMQPDLKLMFLRITNGEDRKPVSAVGHIRKSSLTDKTEVNGLPESLSGAQLSRTTVSWNPIAAPGWVAVIRSAKGPLSPSQTERSDDLFTKSVTSEAACALGNALNGLLGTSDRQTSGSQSMLLDSPAGPAAKLEAWVPGVAGKFELSSALGADESITLIFIGTEKEVASPVGEGTAQEPELFTYAKELRMVRLK